MRITGAARLIVREMPIDMLVQGRVVDDGQGNMIQLSGLGMLLRTLERRYGATTEETQVHSISELMQFARQSGESTDEVIARFDVLVHRADTVGGVQFGAQLKAWLLLTHLRIPRSAWMVLLAPTKGLLPQNIQEYTDFQQYVRRNGPIRITEIDKSPLHNPTTSMSGNPMENPDWLPTQIRINLAGRAQRDA